MPDFELVKSQLEYAPSPFLSPDIPDTDTHKTVSTVIEVIKIRGNLKCLSGFGMLSVLSSGFV